MTVRINLTGPGVVERGSGAHGDTTDRAPVHSVKRPALDGCKIISQHWEQPAKTSILKVTNGREEAACRVILRHVL